MEVQISSTPLALWNTVGQSGEGIGRGAWWLFTRRMLEPQTFPEYGSRLEFRVNIGWETATQEPWTLPVYTRNPRVVEPKGDVKFFIKTMEAWGFSRAEAGKMLGIRNEDRAEAVFNGTIDLPEGDVDDRLTMMTKMILDLDGMYEDDIHVRRWLDLQRDELGGKTARDLLTCAA